MATTEQRRPRAPSGIPVSPTLVLDEHDEDGTIPIADDLAALRCGIVNVFFHGLPGAGDGEWVLVDAGLAGTADLIAGAAARRFGEDSRPAGIVLTHGHFDHVGALRALADRWDVPVWAHPLEMPYITGGSAYPPPDPTVGGGAVARLSALFPRKPVDVRHRAHELPEDGSIPGMPGWRWLHTPGHTPGHVSLWREADALLIAGDALVTTKPESLYHAVTQRAELHGPPAYYTQDWRAARESVEKLAELSPAVLATGHGRPLRGDGVRIALGRLARQFDAVAVPARGRYVEQPAIADRTGTVSVPPPVDDPFPRLVVGGAAALAAALFVRGAMRGRNREDDDRPEVRKQERRPRREIEIDL